MKASAIVLCGGRSTRMGFDKAGLAFGPETLLARVVRTAQRVAADVVVVGRPGPEVPDDVRVVRDPIEGLGPLAGLATGLAAVTKDRAIVLACDQPLVVPALLERLLTLGGDADACVPLIQGMPMTTCAVYSTRVMPLAQSHLASGRRSLRGLLDELSVRWVTRGELTDVDPDLSSFLDVDTPEHYRAALALAGFADGWD